MYNSKEVCFWTVVLEKTLVSPLDCKDIKPVHPKGNQYWMFIGRTDAEAPYFGHLKQRNGSLEKTLMLGKREGRSRRGRPEDEMVGWHHQFDGHEFEQAPGVVDGQGSLECCSPWSHRVRHDWATELNWTLQFWVISTNSLETEEWGDNKSDENTFSWQKQPSNNQNLSLFFLLSPIYSILMITLFLRPIVDLYHHPICISKVASHSSMFSLYCDYCSNNSSFYTTILWKDKKVNSFFNNPIKIFFIYIKQGNMNNTMLIT